MNPFRDQRGIIFTLSTVILLFVMLSLLQLVTSAAKGSSRDLQYISAIDRVQNAYAASSRAFIDVFHGAGINVTLDADRRTVTFAEQLSPIDVYQPVLLNITLQDTGGPFTEPHLLDLRTNETVTIVVEAYNAYRDRIDLGRANLDLLRMSDGVQGITCKVLAGATTWYDWGGQDFEELTSDIPLTVQVDGSCSGTLAVGSLLPSHPDDHTSILFSVSVDGFGLERAVAVTEVEVRAYAERCDQYPTCAECTKDTYLAGGCMWDVHTGQCGEAICVPISDFCETEEERGCPQFSPAQTYGIGYNDLALFTMNSTGRLKLELEPNSTVDAVVDLTRTTTDLASLYGAQVTFSGAVTGQAALVAAGNATWTASMTTGAPGLVHHYMTAGELRAAHWPRSTAISSRASSPIHSNFFVGDMTAPDQPCYINLTLVDGAGGYDDPFLVDWDADERIEVKATAFNCRGEAIDAPSNNLTAKVVASATQWYDHGLGDFRTAAADIPLIVSGPAHARTLQAQSLIPTTPDHPTSIILAIEVAINGSADVARSAVELTVLPYIIPTDCSNYTTCTQCAQDRFGVGICMWDTSLPTPSCGHLPCDPELETCVSEHQSEDCPSTIPSRKLGTRSHMGLAASANTGNEMDFAYTYGDVATLILDTTRMDSYIEEGTAVSITTHLGGRNIRVPLRHTAQGTYVVDADVDGNGVVPYRVIASNVRAPNWPHRRPYTARDHELAWAVFWAGEVEDVTQPCYLDIQVMDAGGPNGDPFLLDYGANEQVTLRIEPHDCTEAAIDPDAATLEARLIDHASAWYDHRSGDFQGLTRTIDIPSSVSGYYFEDTIAVRDLVPSNPEEVTTLLLAVEVRGEGRVPVRHALELTIDPAAKPTSCVQYLTCSECTEDPGSVGDCQWDSSAPEGACGEAVCLEGLSTCIPEAGTLRCPERTPADRFGAPNNQGLPLTTNSTADVSFTLPPLDLVDVHLDLSHTTAEVLSSGSVSADLAGAITGSQPLVAQGDGTWSARLATGSTGMVSYDVRATKVTARDWNGSLPYTDSGEELASGVFWVGTMTDPLQPCSLELTILPTTGSANDPASPVHAVNHSFVLRAVARNGLGDVVDAVTAGISARVVALASSWYDHEIESGRDLVSDIQLTPLTNGTFEVGIGIADIIPTSPREPSTLILTVAVEGGGHASVRSFVALTVLPDLVPTSCANYDSCYACNTDLYDVGVCTWDRTSDPPSCGTTCAGSACIKEGNVTACPTMNVTSQLELVSNLGYATTLSVEDVPMGTFLPSESAALYADTSLINGSIELTSALTAHLLGAVERNITLSLSGLESWSARTDLNASGLTSVAIAASSYRAPRWGKSRAFTHDIPLVATSIYSETPLTARTVRQNNERLASFLDSNLGVNLTADMSQVNSRMLLTIHPINLTYDHLSFGGNAVTLLPPAETVVGYSLSVHASQGNVTGAQWLSSPIGVFALTVNITSEIGGTYTAGHAIDPDQSTVLRVDLEGGESIFILVSDGGRLAVFNRASSPLDLVTTATLTPLGDHLPWVGYPDGVVAIRLSDLNVSRVDTVHVA